jgi:DNA-binding CsgD family transcriptional regulator
MNPEAEWENFSLHFETVHPSFFKNLKTKHNNITTNELRLCAYLLMNLSNKEIAILLFISSDAVQKAKYRLKKKFSLSTDDKLFDYLLSI